MIIRFVSSYDEQLVGIWLVPTGRTMLQRNIVEMNTVPIFLTNNPYDPFFNTHYLKY